MKSRLTLRNEDTIRALCELAIRTLCCDVWLSAAACFLQIKPREKVLRVSVFIFIFVTMSRAMKDFEENVAVH